MSFIVFLIILFSLFGPKFGLVDISIFGGVIGLVLVTLTDRPKVAKEQRIFVLFVVVILIYATVVFLLGEGSDYILLLRYFRALLSTIMLGLVFYNIRLKPNALLDTIIIVLMFNAAAIFFQVIFPDIQKYLSEIYGFTKSIRNFRAFGLTAGYDTAGFLCVIGAVITSVSAYYKDKYIRYLLLLLFFASAAFFTSRTSIGFIILVLLIVVLVFMLKHRVNYQKVFLLKISALITLILVIFAVIYYVLPLFLSTFSVPGLELSSSAVSASKYTRYFANTYLAVWKDNAFDLPTGVLKILFGNGVDPTFSDVGYIRLIFSVGVIGLLLIISSYAFLLFRVNKLKNTLNKGSMSGDIGRNRVLILSFMVIVLLICFFNFKNLYFYTRAYHELVVILFFGILANRKLPVRFSGLTFRKSVG